MYRGNRFRIDFRLAIVCKQSIDLLLDVRQLRVTKARQKPQRSNALHQVAILLQQLFRLLKRRLAVQQKLAVTQFNAAQTDVRTDFVKKIVAVVESDLQIVKMRRLRRPEFRVRIVIPSRPVATAV